MLATTFRALTALIGFSHVLSTAITADYGLQFNRVIILLGDDAAIIKGAAGVGQYSAADAAAAWRSDEERELNNLQSYLLASESRDIVPTDMS